jgi:hypothetical protein
MVKQQEKKVLVKSDKLTQGEKKKIKNDNKAKANPEKAAAKKEKNDAKRAGRYVLNKSDTFFVAVVCVCICGRYYYLFSPFLSDLTVLFCILLLC